MGAYMYIYTVFHKTDTFCTFSFSKNDLILTTGPYKILTIFDERLLPYFV